MASNLNLSSGPLPPPDNDDYALPQGDQFNSMQQFIGGDGYAPYENGLSREMFYNSPPSYQDVQRDNRAADPMMHPSGDGNIQGMMIACLQPIVNRLTTLEQAFQQLEGRYNSSERDAKSISDQVKDLKVKGTTVETRLNTMENNTVSDLRKFKTDLNKFDQDVRSSVKNITNLKRTVESIAPSVRSKNSTDSSPRNFELLENRQRAAEEDTLRLTRRVEMLEAITPQPHQTAGDIRRDDDEPPKSARQSQTGANDPPQQFANQMNGFNVPPPFNVPYHGPVQAINTIANSNMPPPPFHSTPIHHNAHGYGNGNQGPTLRQYGAQVGPQAFHGNQMQPPRFAQPILAGNQTQTGQRMLNDSTLPRLPTYNGQTAWSSFINAFEIHSESRNWGLDEMLYYVRLCLTGKALDYLVTMRSQGKCNTYEELIRVMGMRFDRRDDPTTKRAQFNNLVQKVDESIEEWSERVMTHAYEAFVGVNPAFVEEEIVRRFCSGTQDKEAAQFVLNNGVRTLEQALTMMRRFRENSITIFGQRRVRKLSAEPRPSTESKQNSDRER